MDWYFPVVLSPQLVDKVSVVDEYIVRVSGYSVAISSVFIDAERASLQTVLYHRASGICPTYEATATVGSRPTDITHEDTIINAHRSFSQTDKSAMRTVTIDRGDNAVSNHTIRYRYRLALCYANQATGKLSGGIGPISSI